MDIEGVKLIVMFDPVHAAKCTRNNLVEKDLELNFREPEGNRNIERKYAFCDHAQLVYSIEQNGDSLFKMPKLKDKGPDQRNRRK